MKLILNDQGFIAYTHLRDPKSLAELIELEGLDLWIKKTGIAYLLHLYYTLLIHSDLSSNSKVSFRLQTT